MLETTTDEVIKPEHAMLGRRRKTLRMNRLSMDERQTVIGMLRLGLVRCPNRCVTRGDHCGHVVTVSGALTAY